MISEIEQFDSGCYGIFLRFSPQEIERMIKSLQWLRDQESDHFHISDNNTTYDKCIVDIEISLKGKDEVDNMIVH